MSVVPLAFVGVVRTTQKPDVSDRRLASHAVRVDVMELNERPLIAASPALAHESAGTTITPPHRALDLGRDITAARRGTATGPRPFRGCELLPGQVFEESRERPIEDLGHVSGGDGVTEQVLSLA